MKIGARKGLPIVGILLFVGVFLVAFVSIEDVHWATLELLDWVEELEGWGLLFYFFLYVAVVILLVPGFLFTLGAGFLFGFMLGGAVVVGALAAGSGGAFLLARYVFGENLTRIFRENPKVRLLNEGLEEEGWKIVLVSRFSPIFPFKLSNYFFGLTRIPFWQFFFANFVGVLPLTLLNVYIGSLAAEMVELTQREAQPWEWIIYVGGLLAAVGVLFLIFRMVARAMRKGSDKGNDRCGRESNL